VFRELLGAMEAASEHATRAAASGAQGRVLEIAVGTGRSDERVQLRIVLVHRTIVASKPPARESDKRRGLAAPQGFLLARRVP